MTWKETSFSSSTRTGIAWEVIHLTAWVGYHPLEQALWTTDKGFHDLSLGVDVYPSRRIAQFSKKKKKCKYGVKNFSLFIWNSDSTGCLISYLAILQWRQDEGSITGKSPESPASEEGKIHRLLEGRKHNCPLQLTFLLTYSRRYTRIQNLIKKKKKNKGKRL